MALIILSIPFVQSKVAYGIASKINENYDTNIRVGGVSIGANGSISLKSFFIADHHSDTPVSYTHLTLPTTPYV